MSYIPTSGFLESANDLSDVASVPTSQSNLSLTPGVDVQAYLGAGINGQVLTLAAGVPTWATSSSSPGDGFYGDGSDGFISLGAPLTLTADSNFNTLHVPTGIVVNLNGFILRCLTSLTVDAGGIITSSGSLDAVGAAAGSGQSSAQVGGSVNGGTGSMAFGIAGSSIGSNGVGGGGGSGGTSGLNTGGIGGTVTPPSASKGTLRSLPNAANGILLGGGNVTQVNGGAGGGGGAGDSAISGGGGGAGGAIGVILAAAITNNGSINCNGGAGANALGGDASGGGGGGGGWLSIVCKSYTGNAATADGGAKGLKSGTGNDGADGAAGTVILLFN